MKLRRLQEESGLCVKNIWGILPINREYKQNLPVNIDRQEKMIYN